MQWINDDSKTHEQFLRSSWEHLFRLYRLGTSHYFRASILALNNGSKRLEGILGSNETHLRSMTT